MMKRGFVVVAFGWVLAWALWCAAALAQPQWSLTRDGNQLFLEIPADAAMPSTEDLAARLREELQWPTAAPGPVRVGDRAAWGVSEMPDVGRLMNDVFATRGGRQVLLLPRGTPVYMVRYNQRVEGAAHDVSTDLWCGAIANPARNAPRGYCMRSGRSGAQIAALGEGVSPYLPSSFGRFEPSTTPQIDREDGSARAEAPPIEFVYVLDGVDPVRFELTAILRVGADEVRETISAPRGEDGVGALDHGGVIARIRPGPDGSSYTVVVLEPNDGPLREIAEGMLRDARGRLGN